MLQKINDKGGLGHHTLEQSDCSCLKLCWAECRGRAHRRAMENLWIPQNPIMCLHSWPGVCCAWSNRPFWRAQHLCRQWMWSPWRAGLARGLLLGCLELLSPLSDTEPEQGDDVPPCWGCRDVLSCTLLPSQRAQWDGFLTGMCTGRWFAWLAAC